MNENQDENNFYEEMIHGNDIKERKNKTPIFIILFILMILVFGIYVTYLKLNEPKKEEEKKEEDTQVQVEVETIEFVCEDSCEYSVTVNGEKVPITYTVSTEEDFIHKIMINNNPIVNRSFACGGPATLKVLNDIILISYHDGCDVGGNTIHAYTKDGNEIFSYEYLDSVLNMWMENTNFEVENNKIKINATRVYHGYTLRLSNSTEVDICMNDEWLSYQIDENTVTSGVYEIEYFGNNNFSEPILVQKETVGNLFLGCEIEG